MNKNKLSLIATALAALLVSSPAASFAQSAATFSGEAVALKANAVGVSLALADTGALPSSGGSLSTSGASVNVAGIASADALKKFTSGGGSSSPSPSTLPGGNTPKSLGGPPVWATDS